MSERQPPAENKMGTMPVNRLLLSMAIPMMISMLVQALYNVVDSYFVAQISEDALNAVSLAFPVQNLMIAVAVGTGVGINALLSKSLGERRQRRANAAAMNGLFLAVLSCLVFMAIGLTCSRFFFQVQTSQQAIVDYGTEYLSICTVFSRHSSTWMVAMLAPARAKPSSRVSGRRTIKWQSSGREVYGRIWRII